MQISQANLRSIFTGYRVLFNDAMLATKIKSDVFSMQVPSMHDTEVYDWLGSLPGMSKLIGEIKKRNVAGITWNVRNDEYASTLALKQSSVENDSYGLYNPVMQGMGRNAKLHRDVLMFALLNAGFTGLDYTGSPFFSANKKREPKDAGFTNLLTSPLNQFSYASARANILGRLDAEGLAMNLGIKLQLVCGVNNEVNASQILKSGTAIQAVAGTAGGTSVGGAIDNINKGTAEIITSPYIDNSAYPKAWFLLETGFSVQPLIWQVNKEVALHSLTDPESDHVFKFHEFLYQAYGRYAAAYLMPELAVGSTGAGAALTSFP